MNLRQRVETYYAVWMYSKSFNCWVAWTEGLSTRRAAELERRSLEEQHPYARFAVVKTRHERLP